MQVADCQTRLEDLLTIQRCLARAPKRCQRLGMQVPAGTFQMRPGFFEPRQGSVLPAVLQECLSERRLLHRVWRRTVPEHRSHEHIRVAQRLGQQ